MNSETKVITYAYDGLIYLPIFLAYKNGFFPNDVVLAKQKEGGDIEALNSLFSTNVINTMDPIRTTGTSFVTVCDPLLDRNLMQRSTPGRQRNGILVFGCLIDEIPLWVYSNAKIKNEHNGILSLEAFFNKCKQVDIEKYVYYKLPNTGGLVARYILDKYNHFRKKNGLAEIEPSSHEEVGFNEEFNFDNSIIFSSDLLTLCDNSNADRVKLQLCANPNNDEELKKFFFTGLVTLQSSIENNLPSLLQILNGIKKSLQILTNESERSIYFDQIYEIMKNNLNEKFPSYSDADKKIILSKSLETLFHRYDIYTENLEINKLQWDKNISLREKYQKDYNVPSYRIFTEEIPLVLIKRDWKSELMKRRDQLLKSKSKHDIIYDPNWNFWFATIFGSFWFVIETILTINSIKKFTSMGIFNSSITNSFLIIISIVQLSLIVLLFLDRYNKFRLIDSKLLRTWTYLVPSVIYGNIIQ